MVLGTAPLPAAGEPIDTLVLPGGDGAQAARHDAGPDGLDRGGRPRCRRVATVCTGTFLAADAGLLDGRTGHHPLGVGRAPGRASSPTSRWTPTRSTSATAKYWTSAGVTAGIDLALALVEDDLGAEVAQTVARWLVMFLHRPGGQTQFASPVWVPRAERSAVRAVAEPGGVGPGRGPPAAGTGRGRGHERAPFRPGLHREVGETPGRFVERVRLEAARHELETSDAHAGR